jgi:putative ABC transport system substrate-binding protein
MRKTGNIRLRAFIFVGIILCSGLCAPAAAAENGCKIVIVKSFDIPSYNITLEGFNEVINTNKVVCDTFTFDLGNKKEKPEEILQKMRDIEPDVILAIGTRATSLLKKNFTDTPIVFSAVLYPVASKFVPDMKKPGGNVTGAAIDVPIEHQFKTLSEIVPKLKRVGVLYCPLETQPVVEEARRVAKLMNLELLAEEVNSVSDVDDALKRLDRKNMDALWSVVDGMVLNDASKGYIGKYVVRRGIPFMVPSKRYIKDGALVALTADVRDCGRQAGEIVVKILNGTNPKNIPIATARTVEMGLNLRTAEYISLDVPQGMIDKASVVIE